MKNVNKKVKKINLEKWEKHVPLFASFFLPLLIAITVAIDHGIYPFGDRCVLQVDMYHQYCPFLAELMDIIQKGESLQYTFNIGLGADFTSVFAYYLASPFYWIAGFVPKASVVEFMAVVMIFKFGLCGLTFGYFLKEHFKTNDFSISVFATAYAFSGYMTAYAWNIMWTDCLILLPLIILGLEKLVNEGKCTLYYVSLAVCIFSNYYISIMVCIFLVLYFGVIWLECEGGKIKAIFNFGWYSLLAGGTAAVLIIPEVMLMSAAASGSSSFPKTMEWYFNIMAALSRQLMLTEDYVTGRDHWPNLYCGVFVLVFLVLYILNRGISWKKKIPRLLLVVLFVVSFANNFLDYIWHGLHFPEALPARQSFLYMFLLLFLSYEVYVHLKETKWWHLVVALILDAAFLVGSYLCYKESELAENVEVTEGIHFLGAGFDRFDISAIFIVVYLVVLLVHTLGNRHMKKLMGMGLCMLMLTETTAHFSVEGLGTSSRTTFLKSYEDYQNVLSLAELKEEAQSENGETFYRVELFERLTKNDAALHNFNSASAFQSIMNVDMSRFFQYVGMQSGKNSCSFDGATPLISAIFSMKYIMADNDLEESPLRTLVASSGDVYLYENLYTLPLGFVMPDCVIEEWVYKGNSDVTNINNLATMAGAKTSLLVPVECNNETGLTTIEVEEDGYFYVAYDKTSIGTINEEVSNGRTKKFTKVNFNYLLDLGYAKAGETIKLKNTEDGTLPAHAYKVNFAALEEAYHALNEQTMTLVRNDISEIDGTIEMTTPGYLTFSIVEEEGWKVFVDGKEAEIATVAETLLAVYLEEGYHTIELRYETPGLKLGAGISFGCIAAFVLTEFLKRKIVRSVGNKGVIE